MDKQKIIAFIVIFFSVSALVQNIQIQEERENWKKFCVQLEIDRSEAALPLLVTVVPVVLSAIVTGAAIGWTQYNANGKEAWLKFTGAVKDGAAVTKQWIQEKIAELNGIDTSPSQVNWHNSDTLLSSGITPETSQSLVGQKIRIGDYLYTLYVKIHDNGHWATYPTASTHGTYGHVVYLAYSTATMPYSSLYYGGAFGASRQLYDGEPQFGGSGFDPSEHPDLYTGPALLSNCHAVANAYPDIKPTYEMSTIQPPDSENATSTDIGGYLNGYIIDPQGNKIDINTALQSANTITGPDGTVYDLSQYAPAGNYIEDSQGNRIYLSDILTDDGGTITYSNGTTVHVPKYGVPTYVDSTGNILDSLPPDVANHLGLDISELSHNAYSDKYIQTGVATPDTADDGRKLLPGWLDTRLKGAGIDLGAGSTIKGVSKDGRIDWVDSSGVARTTLVDSTMAESLIQQGVAVRTVTNGKVTYAQAPATSTPADPMDFSDPGSPPPPSMGSGEFDPSFNWGEKDEFDTDHWTGVLGSLPLVNLLKGSSLQLATSNPVLSIPLNSWPGGPITLHVDFSDYEYLFNLMGGIIYFFALIYSISLALLGRGL